MATPSQYNVDLANRQIQVNEWAYNNKNDTLFVLQLLFISLMFITILMVLQGMDSISSHVVWYSIGVITIIDVVIIINRSVYTNTKRDTKSWNKKKFNGDNSTNSPLSRGDKDYQAYIDSVRTNYGPTASTSKCICPTPVKCC